MGSRVMVVGSANLDMVFQTQRFPNPGETLLGGEFASHPGGKGANQAVAVGKLGGEVSFVGCIGSDAFGDVLRDSLVQAGVDVTHLLRHPTTPSGCAGIVVDAAGSNQIIVAPGANMELTAAQVHAALAQNTDSSVLVQLEIPMAAVKAAATRGRLFLNPAPAQSLDDELLAKTFAITPNETETELLTGIRPQNPETCRSAAKALFDKGVQNVVLTLGEKGCFWMSDKGELYVPALEANAIDTVAAGDAFNGALAWFYSETGDLPNALVRANQVTALSVTKRGAQSSMPTREELEQRFGR